MNLSEIIARADQLRDEIDALRPLNAQQEGRIMQKFRLDWNYHSNAIEGNTLSLGETRAFLLHGITAQGKPFKDYLDIKGHNEAIAYLEKFVRGQNVLTEVDLRRMHEILLVEPYEVDAVTPDGQPTKRRIAIGQYKTMPNHVKTSTGEIHYYATPEETSAQMGDLMQWYRTETQKGNLHPLIIAATFHYRFVAIHPFDDGNGRMARLLTNLILMQGGYVPVIITIDSKPDYLLALEKADAGDLEDFTILIGEELIRSLELYLRGARGESIEDLADLDKRVALLEKQLETEIDSSKIQKVSKTETLNSFIIPLLEKISLQFEKFKVFFERLSNDISCERDNISPTIGQDQPTSVLINRLTDTVNSDPDLSRIRATFQLISFIKQENYRIEVYIIISLRHTDFEIQYRLGDSTDRNIVQQELMSGNYNQRYTEEDIDEMVLRIGNKVYGLIEEKANG